MRHLIIFPRRPISRSATRTEWLPRPMRRGIPPSFHSKRKTGRNLCMPSLSGLAYNGQAVGCERRPAGVCLVLRLHARAPGDTDRIAIFADGSGNIAQNRAAVVFAAAGQTQGRFVYRGVYGGKNTLVLEYKNKKLNLQTFSGLKLLKFATNAGSFSWSY